MSNSWRWRIAYCKQPNAAHTQDMETFGFSSMDVFKRHWRTFLPWWLYSLFSLVVIAVLDAGPRRPLVLRVWLVLFFVVNVMPIVRYMRGEITRREWAFLGGFVPFLIWIIAVMVLLGVAWLRR